MPFVQITLVEGRSIEQKHDLMKRVAEVTADALGAELTRVRVALYEVSADEWSVGGVAMSVSRPVG
jgi:4-oxalocrotonate tautomerase